jgi:flagellar biosynthesis protein FlhB
MAEEDDAQKTEDPTAKKLSQARQKGQVATSQEIKSWGILLAATMGLVMLVPGMMRDVSTMGARFLRSPHAIPADFEHFRLVLAEVLIELGFIVGPLLGLLLVLGLFASVVQTGFMVSPGKIKPELKKISLIAGVKRMFSMRSLVEFLKGLLKLAIVSTVAFGMAIPLLDDVALIPSLELIQSLDRLHEVAFRLIAGTVGVMTAVAILDFAFQKMQHLKQMRMSKQEVKDEFKQTEGDPMVKGRIRRLRMERAQRRMMAAVPEADVVVTNPTHYAVALKYEMETMPAPKLVAKGMDTLAHRIREVAEEHDIAIVENPPVARALYAAVEIDEEIPVEHYKAVAEIIGFVMRLKGKLRGQ